MKDRIYEPGALIGHYQVLQRLGLGPLSAVYEAVDLKDAPDAEPSALKVSRFDFDSLSPSLQHALNARMRREYEALEGLEHGSIVPVFESGFHGGAAWYAMKRLQGHVRLDEYLSQRPRCREVLLVFRQIVGALAHAHGHGVVHGNLTPANILVSPHAEVFDEVDFDDFNPPNLPKLTARVPVLIDFGSVHLLGAERSVDLGGFEGAASFWTPDSAAALLEGLKGLRHVRPHEDIYQAGLVLYLMLTGRLPTSTPPSQLLALLREIRDGKPRSPREVNPEAPRALSELAMRCLAKHGEPWITDGRELAWRFNAALYEDGALEVMTRAPAWAVEPEALAEPPVSSSQLGGLRGVAARVDSPEEAQLEQVERAVANARARIEALETQNRWVARAALVGCVGVLGLGLGGLAIARSLTHGLEQTAGSIERSLNQLAMYCSMTDVSVKLAARIPAGLKMPATPDANWLKPSRDGTCRDPETGEQLHAIAIRGACWTATANIYYPDRLCPSPTYDPPPELKNDYWHKDSCFRPVELRKGERRTVEPEEPKKKGK